MSIKEIVGKKLTIGVGTDHAGFSAKGKLVQLLVKLLFFRLQVNRL